MGCQAPQQAASAPIALEGLGHPHQAGLEHRDAWLRWQQAQVRFLQRRHRCSSCSSCSMASGARQVLWCVVVRHRSRQRLGWSRWRASGYLCKRVMNAGMRCFGGNKRLCLWSLCIAPLPCNKSHATSPTARHVCHWLHAEWFAAYRELRRRRKGDYNALRKLDGF
jgi:hypothetical protein